MLRYIIRSLKCLFMVAVLFSIIVLVMFYTSEHDANLRPWNLFDGQWTKVILFFVAYAAVYPLIGYSKKEVAFGEGFSARRQEIIGLLREMNLVPEEAGDLPDVLKLHNKSGIIRALRLFEDTVTLTDNAGMVTVEGQRKDVVRVAMKLDRYLQERAENENQQ
ncbi:MAG: hypothetical protein J6X91_07060 [Bacteroidales bacterium]|nr:hypothetical protein [Bacteroidales bacterium]MBP5518394.1 hypothetical protein [Bacteroidales bacterium]